MLFRAFLTLLIAFPVIADEPANPEGAADANPGLDVFVARVDLIRSQAAKKCGRIEEVFNTEAAKLRTTLVEAMQSELEKKMESKDLDASLKLRDGIKEYEAYTPALTAKLDAIAAKLQYKTSLTTSFWARLKLLRSQASKAMKTIDREFADSFTAMRSKTVDGLASDIEEAMEDQKLDFALALRSLSRDIQDLQPGTVLPSSSSMVVPDQERRNGSLRQGLIRQEFPRSNTQHGSSGFVELLNLNGSIGEPTVVKGESFKYNEKHNAVFFGYLKIEKSGLYCFRAYNFYDRSAVYVNGIKVCPYRGSVSGGSDGGSPSTSREKIVLPKGLVPIALVGYVDARGNVEQFSWARPGETAHSAIPSSGFFYSDELLKKASSQTRPFKYSLLRTRN